MTDPLRLLEGYQGSAIVAAAVETGVADALAEAPRTAAQVSKVCGTDGRGTKALLGAMAAFGLAELDEDRFRLSEDGATLARSHPETMAEIVAKEWFFYGAWQGLAETVRDGHARIAPWRDRLESDPDTAHAFLRALDDLAARFGGELPMLAGLESGGRLLDVGGGAGSHAAKLVEAVPGLEATVLDLPAVEPVLRERHGELSFIAGNLDEERFGRPGGEGWDVVLLANILHDHPAERCVRYVAEAASLLVPGGTLLAYEWILDEAGTGPPAVAPFALMMMVENEGGYTWTEKEIGGWMMNAGLVDVELRRGGSPIAVVRARRPRTDPGGD